jgi:hypothetical protein
MPGGAMAASANRAKGVPSQTRRRPATNVPLWCGGPNCGVASPAMLRLCDLGEFAGLNCVFDAGCAQSAILRLCSSCILRIGLLDCWKKAVGRREFLQSVSGLLFGWMGERCARIVRRLLGRLIVAHSDRRYLCGSAYARAVWAPPLTADDRIAWNRWVKGIGTAIASTLAIGLVLAPESRPRPLEATVQMERLADKLERMKAVHPSTARAITTLVLQPSHDCHQVVCSPAVQARNSIARARITATLAKWNVEPAAGVAVNLGTRPSTEAAR